MVPSPYNTYVIKPGDLICRCVWGLLNDVCTDQSRYLSRFESLPLRIRAGFANEWAGASGEALLPGMDDDRVLEAAGLIPREGEAVGMQFPSRSTGGGQVYPTEGAQDFLGSNVPDLYWVEPPPADTQASGAKL